ncbi:MAG: formylmethanofuran dehydrogenase, partial [Nitrospirae bacterium]
GKTCFNLVVCEKCGDVAAENYIRIEDGKKVCIDCWSY